MGNFAYRIDYRAIIKPKNSILSLSSFSIHKKQLTATEHTETKRITPQEHFDKLIVRPCTPMVVLGIRNVLSNLRCIAYSRKMCAQFSKPTGTLAMVNEEAIGHNRPYHALRLRDGKYCIDEFKLSDDLEDTEWLVTGIPVLWDCEEKELFDRLITDAADHSHVWRLPRRQHANATNEVKKQWLALQSTFIQHLSSDRDTAATALRKVASHYNLQREEHYLHSIWAVGKKGELIIIITQGKLETIGSIANQYGASRAICVENGGSCGLYLVEDPSSTWNLQVSAPNFRPKGTAFVFFELDDISYVAIPSEKD